MPFDGVMVYSLVKELQSKLEGTRIDRITQPEKDELVLQMRATGAKYELLLSSSAECARVSLTGERSKQSDHPPMFCMLMRKHLTGGRFIKVRQKGLDRVIYFDFSARNELGDEAVWTLAVEMMGRHSNIILIDEQNWIVDAIKRVYPDKSRVRPVLPQMEYLPPPGDVKPDPCLMDAQSFHELIFSLPDGDIEKQLVKRLDGVSPGTSRELLARAGLNAAGTLHISSEDRKRLSAICFEFFSRLSSGEHSPNVAFDGAGVPRDIRPLEYISTTELEPKKFGSPSEAIDAYFSGRSHALKIQQRSSDLSHLLKTRIERAEKKLALRMGDLEDADRAEIYKLYGELLSSYIYLAKKGDRSLTVSDYTSEDGHDVTIPLDPARSPAQNVQDLFHKYARSRSAKKQLSERIKEAEDELVLLRQMEYDLSQADGDDDVEAVRDEMTEAGILKRQKKKNGRDPKKQKKQDPRHDASGCIITSTSTGYTVKVGRNNRQNDALTRSADGNDLWLHAKGRPGSHVIVELNGREADDATILEAAKIAAKYSSTPNDSRVPVDYTYRRFVKKPGGAAPGFVIYTDQHTITVSPL